MSPQELAYLAIYVIITGVMGAVLVWASDTLAPEGLRQILRVAIIVIVILIILIIVLRFLGIAGA